MFWKRKDTTTPAETPTTTIVADEVVIEVAEALEDEPVATVVEEVPVAEPGVVPSFVAETGATAEPAKGGSGKAFLAGAVVGVGLGAAAALLFAPKSGEETRSELSEKGIELKNTVTSKTPSTSDLNETFSGWKDTVTDTASSVQDATKQAASSVQGTISDATAKVSDSLPSSSDAKSAVSDAASDVTDAADSAKQDVETNL